MDHIVYTGYFGKNLLSRLHAFSNNLFDPIHSFVHSFFLIKPRSRKLALSTIRSFDHSLFLPLAEHSLFRQSTLSLLLCLYLTLSSLFCLHFTLSYQFSPTIQPNAINFLIAAVNNHFLPI